MIALGKWRGSILKSGMGTHKEGTDAREEENKDVACFEDEQGTKHLRTRGGAGTQVGELLFPPLLPKKHTTSLQTSGWKHLLMSLRIILFCHTCMYIYISI